MEVLATLALLYFMVAGAIVAFSLLLAALCAGERDREEMEFHLAEVAMAPLWGPRLVRWAVGTYRWAVKGDR